MAVIVTSPALSSALIFIVVDLSVPAFGGSSINPLGVAVHVAGPGLTVRFTSSPTPILVLARLLGNVVTVCDVIVHAFGQEALG